MFDVQLVSYIPPTESIPYKQYRERRFAAAPWGFHYRQRISCHSEGQASPMGFNNYMVVGQFDRVKRKYREKRRKI